jgi:hypothetical protein
MESRQGGFFSRLFGSRKVRSIAHTRTEVRPHNVSSEDDALRSVTPHLLGVTMLQLVMDRGKEWRKVEPSVTAEIDAKFPMACECYQLSIFLDLLSQRFGRRIAGLVEASLNAVMDFDDKVPLFPRFKSAINHARDLGPADDGPNEPNLRVDWQVAKQLLSIVSEPEEEKEKIRPLLGESLSYARIWAESVYPGVVAKIEFDPVSIAKGQRETAYKGTTNRWRQNPGCFERQLQRMEGNPLYPEDQRQPSDADIRVAREKDDADRKQLDLDVQRLLADFKNLIKVGTVEGKRLIDFLQHRVEPLMERSAEVSESAVQQHVPTLQKLILTSLNTLKKSSGTDLETDTFERSWRRMTNVFIAQKGRDDTPIGESDVVISLLCEDAKTIEEVVSVYHELDPGIIDSMREMARLHLELAVLDGFELPSIEEKLALLESESG